VLSVETLVPRVVERGSVASRPWGATLASFGLTGQTGQISVRSSDNRLFAIALDNGNVVGAVSPLTADGVTRIAASEKFVTAKRSAEIARIVKTLRHDELDGFADAAGLSAGAFHRLKRRVLLQRAARTFSVEEGEFELEPIVTIPVIAGFEVDIRAVIYQGARLNLSGDQLAAALRRVDSRFVLVGDEDLAPFEFGEAEEPLLASIRAGTTIPELEAAHRELDPRMVQAVVYTLAACGRIARDPTACCMGPLATAPAHAFNASAAIELAAVPVAVHEDPTVAAAPWKELLAQADVETRPAAMPMPATGRVPTAHTVRADAVRAAAPTRAQMRTMTEPFLEARATTVRPNALAAHEVKGLIALRSEMVEEGVDHFTLLAVPVGASVEAIREAYVELARYLAPERLVELGIRDQEFEARSLFAQICIAFTVLTDPVRRAEYVAGLCRSGDFDAKRLAREAYIRGERALRQDEIEIAVAELRTACELEPDTIEYVATLGRAEHRAAEKSRGSER
jgi:hypothetical protein